MCPSMRRFVASAFSVLLVPLMAGCLDVSKPPTSTVPVAPPYRLDCVIAPGMGGVAWPQACVALASSNESPSKAEVDIAVNPKDPLNVVVASKDKDPRASNDCVWSVAQVTKDGGKTWTTVYIGGEKTARVPEAVGYECVTDPIMTFGADGVFYYALQIYDHSPRGNTALPGVGNVPDTGSAFILARSRDGGLHFDRFVVQAEGAGDLVFHDYPRMIANPASGSIHTIWNAFVTAPGPVGAGTIRPIVATTRDGGQTVAAPVVVQRPEGGADAPLAFFSGFGATSDGTIYVTMQKDENSDAGEPTNVWIYKSADDARTFTEVGKAFTINPMPRQAPGHEYRTPAFVEMAIDTTSGAHGGRIYTFWPEWTNDQSDVVSSFSDDGGRTWSGPVNIATQTARDQFFMRPAVGPDGRVHVLFATEAYSGSELTDQVHAWSVDGGHTWENQRLTTVSSDGDKGIHQDGFPFIGDYNGLKVGPDGTVHAAWGDTATGRAEIAYARILANA